jgi:hypothetical protein
MRQKETAEFAICFSAYLREIREASNTDAADIANLATEMVRHLIRKYPSIREEMELMDDLEILEELGI